MRRIVQSEVVTGRVKHVHHFRFGIMGRILPIGLIIVFLATAVAETAENIEIPSTIDGGLQSVYIIPAETTEPRPLLVFLHWWSSDFDPAMATEWIAQAQERGWHFAAPNFRGGNNRPEACASQLARQDILDAVDYMVGHYKVDESRVYLAGTSGGGHMTLVMAAHAPERWAAASAWCGISDLTAWHAESRAAGRKYAEDIELVAGGAPGSSPEVDAELRLRSPLFHLKAAKDLPVDINAGIHDGHTGSVPIHHSIDAFNALARAHDTPTVSQAEINRLSQEQSLDTNEPHDASYGRTIHLRREAGPSRITIFEGGHEGLPAAACAWLAQYPATVDKE